MTSFYLPAGSMDCGKIDPLVVKGVGVGLVLIADRDLEGIVSSDICRSSGNIAVLRGK